MKNWILFISLHLVFAAFAQEQTTPVVKPEIKIRDNNRVHQVSRVNNNQVLERKYTDHDHHLHRHQGKHFERHHRPHFDKNRDLKEHHRKEGKQNDFRQRENNRERPNDQRQERMERHRFR